ncbi:hypothetical protein PSACC_03136 [Paramicrosporidium saccamoebae]|uniref:MSP domain-containing protein n=1 Tax=Paramicrosporidium saccamoebae TaxID=1246581 RepID=A0A2H9THI9_9FUNG|nr:hypothetical protein PSACC_03136 [Paramicrosporidium saccamoebae]
MMMPCLEKAGELPVHATLRLTNSSKQEDVLYRVQTTSPATYRVRPSHGRISVNQHVDIQVMMVTDPVRADKFLVKYVTVPSSLPQGEFMEQFQAAENEAMEHRLRVAVTNETFGSTVSERESPVVSQTGSLQNVNGESLAAELKEAKAKIQVLVSKNQELTKSLEDAKMRVLFLLTTLQLASCSRLWGYLYPTSGKTDDQLASSDLAEEEFVMIGEDVPAATLPGIVLAQGGGAGVHNGGEAVLDAGTPPVTISSHPKRSKRGSSLPLDGSGFLDDNVQVQDVKNAIESGSFSAPDELRASLGLSRSGPPSELTDSKTSNLSKSSEGCMNIKLTTSATFRSGEDQNKSDVWVAENLPAKFTSVPSANTDLALETIDPQTPTTSTSESRHSFEPTGSPFTDAAAKALALKAKRRQLNEWLSDEGALTKSTSSIPRDNAALQSVNFVSLGESLTGDHLAKDEVVEAKTTDLQNETAPLETDDAVETESTGSQSENVSLGKNDAIQVETTDPQNEDVPPETDSAAEMKITDLQPESVSLETVSAVEMETIGLQDANVPSGTDSAVELETTDQKKEDGSSETDDAVEMETIGLQDANVPLETDSAVEAKITDLQHESVPPETDSAVEMETIELQTENAPLETDTAVEMETAGQERGDAPIETEDTLQSHDTTLQSETSPMDAMAQQTQVAALQTKVSQMEDYASPVEKDVSTKETNVTLPLESVPADNTEWGSYIAPPAPTTATAGDREVALVEIPEWYDCPSPSKRSTVNPVYGNTQTTTTTTTTATTGDGIFSSVGDMNWEDYYVGPKSSTANPVSKSSQPSSDPNLASRRGNPNTEPIESKAAVRRRGVNPAVKQTNRSEEPSLLERWERFSLGNEIKSIFTDQDDNDELKPTSRKSSMPSMSSSPAQPNSGTPSNPGGQNEKRPTPAFFNVLCILRQNAPKEGNEIGNSKTAENVNGFIIRQEYDPKYGNTDADDALKQLSEFEVIEETKSSVAPEGNDNCRATVQALLLDDFVNIHPHSDLKTPNDQLTDTDFVDLLGQLDSDDCNSGPFKEIA